MRVLHFCPSRSFSGMEQYVLDLARDQKNRGLDVFLLAHPEEELAARAHLAGISVLKFDAEKAFAKLRFKKLFFTFLKETAGPLVLHLHSTQDLSYIWYSFLLLSSREKKKIKVILQNHIWIDRSKKDPLHWFSYRAVDEVWCSSERARQELQRCLPISEEKLRVVHYGRNVSEMEENLLPQDAARERLGLPQDLVLFGYVARMEQGKGTRELFDAAQGILEKNKNVGFVFIGGPSPKDAQAQVYYEKLMDDLKKSPLNKRIFFLGFVEGATRFFKAFDVFVLPSYKECFSLSLLDAQLAGLPTIGTNSGGTPDVVIPSKTGWLVEPANVSNLAQVLGASLVDQALWGEFGQRARERVVEEFNQQNIFSGIIKFYGEIKK